MASHVAGPPDWASGKHRACLRGSISVVSRLCVQRRGARTASAVGRLPVRSLSTDITLFLDALRPQLDVDGDSQVNAQTDGLIVLRYMLGLRGNALRAGIVGAGPRPVGQIETYIQSLMP